MAQHIGCQTFWSNFPGIPVCPDWSSLKKYIRSYDTLLYMNIPFDYHGCLDPCIYIEYQVTKINTRQCALRHYDLVPGIYPGPICYFIDDRRTQEILYHSQEKLYPAEDYVRLWDFGDPERNRSLSFLLPGCGLRGDLGTFHRVQLCHGLGFPHVLAQTGLGENTAVTLFFIFFLCIYSVISTCILITL